MKTVVLDGTHDGRELEKAAREALAAELEARGDDVTVFPLREMDIHHCLGCFGCWIKTPGECVIDDGARDIARAVVHSDLIVYLTPVTFGGYSYHLKKAIDRNIPIISPDFTLVRGETHHKKRYERYPRIVGVGLLQQPDEESERIFRTVLERNAINMHAPAHAVDVVYSDARPARMRAQMRELLNQVEVVK